MVVAGVDIGAATAKAVLLNDGQVLASTVSPTGASVSGAADMVINKVLAERHLSMSDIKYVMATGYGRRAVSYASKVSTEIICHAIGAHHLLPAAQTVIDIGGQDSKVIRLDKVGNVANFVMNDKCAAGTGRFLEVMANVLQVDISDIGELSLRGHNPCQVTSTCTVFAESEMISLRAEGRSSEDILAGIHRAMAHRIAIMGSPVGFQSEIVFSGGVAYNTAMRKALETELKLPIRVLENPQIIGALGAAILAAAELSRSQPS
jgi:(R)-2-hydroxyacyl-CoA dehydratese activating ATPase